MRRHTILAVGVITALVLLEAAVAADGNSLQQPSVSGGAVTAVTALGSAEASSTSGPRWVDIPGAVAEMEVLADQQAFLLARFSGEGTGFGDWMYVRIVVGNGGGTFVEMKPRTGNNLNFAFDTEVHYVERFTSSLGSGTYTVKVQFSSGGSEVTMANWSLVVERVSMP